MEEIENYNPRENKDKKHSIFWDRVRVLALIFSPLLIGSPFIYNSYSREREASKLEKGVIYEKEYVPEHKGINMIGGRPMPFRHPERYVIKIRGEINDKDIEKEISVSREIYNSLEIGQEYNIKR